MAVVAQTYVFREYEQWYKSGGHYSPEVLETLISSMREDAGNTKGDGSGRFRPSAIGNKCDRLQVLSHLGDRSNFQGNWYTWSGTWLHLGFQTWLLERFTEENLAIEHPVKPRDGDVGVQGKADWYWYGPTLETAHGALVGPHFGDYKTISTLEQVNKSGPKREHLQQLLYEMYTRDTRYGYIVYQTRGHGETAGFRIAIDGKDIDRIGKRLEVLQSHIDGGTIPAMLEVCKTFGKTYKDCSFAEGCLSRHLGEEE